MKSKDRPLQLFGLNVKRIRNKHALSQEELAFRAQLHRTYIGGIERGERNVGLLNIIKLANALDTSAEQLMRGVK